VLGVFVEKATSGAVGPLYFGIVDLRVEGVVRELVKDILLSFIWGFS
jgi:hypothetical protein